MTFYHGFNEMSEKIGQLIKMGTLSSKQIKFALNVSRLIRYAHILKIPVKITCLYRTPKQQKYLYDTGKSKTLNSYHLKGLAIDLAIIRGGKAIWSRESFEPLGRYWADEIRGVWGGDWKFKDCPHFQYKEGMGLEGDNEKPISLLVGGEKEE